MILPDLNLLLYAYNPHVAQHALARAWWEGVLNKNELIAIPHEISFGFVRIATNPRLGNAAVTLSSPRRPAECSVALPQIRVLMPSSGHFQRVMELMRLAQARGSLLSDAILAAYALEHGARLCTTDSDFSRFPGLDWENPLL